MIKVDLKKGIYVQTHPKAKVTHVYGKVVLKIGRGIMELTTTAAHLLAFALLRKGRDSSQDDYVVMTINKVDINLLPHEAKRIAASLLVRSDDADDFQIGLGL